MPDSSIRFVEKEYAHNNEIVSFSDEYPLLLIGQGSLDDLNKKLKIPIGMERFRPNIVVATDNPFEEDEWKQIRINSIEVIMAKPCARCAVPSINPVTAAKEKEPGATLAQFRMRDNKIYFGQNLLPKMNGQISCGDLLEIIK
ncbi:MAG: MOSC domain-containing protein [Bacteroidetes bacterium]|nr:MOSC domain-containing protein [Bacteroidota bacterium]